MAQLFHDSYRAAREAFVVSAKAAGFDTVKWAIPGEGPDGGPLSVDVAIKAKGDIQRAVVISSGTHGVEGYYGSAVQLSLLQDRLTQLQPGPGEAVVLLHAVNPWGMAHKRRVNEDGVDLNRNFLCAGEAYEGAPDGYHQLNDLLNPTTPPQRLDLFLPRAGAVLARHGFGTLKDAVAGGQYEYDTGLFFGGKAATASLQVMAKELPALLGDAERVIHIDLHTGMGKWTTYALAYDEPDPKRIAQLSGEMAAVQGLDASGVLYKIRGALGPWLQHIMPRVQYDAVLAEFGTWNVIRVLYNLRWENRAFHHATSDGVVRDEGRDRIMETFCPADPAWRETCVKRGRGIYEEAAAAVLQA